MKPTTAAGRWVNLDGLRQGLMRRWEKYAELTSPRTLPPLNHNQNTEALENDWQSLGAQCVNNLQNKMMLAMFAPSRPFFKYEIEFKVRKLLQEQLGLDDAAIDEALSVAERKVTRRLDKLRGAREKLYQVLRHLIVLGNVLLVMEKDALRVLSVRNYCVKRSVSGKVIELIIKETVMFDELEDEVRASVRARDADSMVSLYKWIKFEDGKYRMTQWLENDQLPKKFNGEWPEEKFKYHVLVWDLADSDDYGTGYVEDNSGDLSALSLLSEAEVQGGVLAAEVRYGVDPSSITKPEDFAKSENGDALPARKDEIFQIEGASSSNLKLVIDLAERRERRLSRAFLLMSGITRDAERVTREEILQTARELETALGGAYTRIGNALQYPIAKWLTEQEGVDLNGTSLEPVILTGLEALSRSGDVEAVKSFLNDYMLLQNVPPEVSANLKLDTIGKAFASGHGLVANDYIKSAAEIKQDQAQAMNNQLAMSAGESSIDAAATSAAQAATGAQ